LDNAIGTNEPIVSVSVDMRNTKCTKYPGQLTLSEGANYFIISAYTQSAYLQLGAAASVVQLCITVLATQLRLWQMLERQRHELDSVSSSRYTLRLFFISIHYHSHY
jgi:hypothetical protein